jgi:hypothetical protein
MNNPSFRQDGVDGEPIFQDWMDGLCPNDDDAFLDCSVVSITQDLDTGVPKLTVIYDVGGEIEGGVLRMGPFPTTETAQCQDGVLAEVRLGTAAVKGYDPMGNEVWETETSSPTEAVVGQGAPITIYARSSGG